MKGRSKESYFDANASLHRSECTLVRVTKL